MRYVSDFIGAVKARKEAVVEGLSVGNAADYASYQRLVGHIAGLEEAIVILDNLLKEEDDDR
jgi:hypothetical protein